MAKKLVKAANKVRVLPSYIPPPSDAPSPQATRLQLLSSISKSYQQSSTPPLLKISYKASAAGYDREEKREELFHPDSRFIILRDDMVPVPVGMGGEGMVGFAMFRFDTEETAGDRHAEVLYCYEVQVEKESRGKGIGTVLVNVMEKLGKAWGMEKVMLTVFREAFDDDSLPSCEGSILEEKDEGVLKAWSERVREKWIMAGRVVKARDEHHRQFYLILSMVFERQQGGDWGHCLFVSTLKDETMRLERLLKALDQRAYILALNKSQASWILDTPPPSFICNEDAPLTPPPTPKLLPTQLSLTKNQRKKAHRKGKASSTDVYLDNLCAADCCAAPEHLTTEDHLSRLRDYLVPPCELPPSISPTSWHRVVSSLFRQVILRLPNLTPLVLSPSSHSSSSVPLNSVEAFLDHLESRIGLKCGEEIKVLWEGMKFAKKSGDKQHCGGFLGVEVLGDAMRELGRKAEEMEEMGVELLGGKVYKEVTREEMSREAWEMFYQFVGASSSTNPLLAFEPLYIQVSCAGCSLSITSTFTAWTWNRRLALIGAMPAWLFPGESEAEKLFRLAGVVLCTSNLATCGRKIKRVEPKDSSSRRRGSGKTVVVEEWERAWMYCKFPLESEWSNAILEALSASNDFTILARNLSTNENTHTAPDSSCNTSTCKCCSGSEIWLGRVRSGLCPAERRAASWTTTTFFPTDTVMDAFRSGSSPEHRFGFAYTDARDVLIIDNRPYSSPGDYQSFSANVADVVMTSRGAMRFEDLLRSERSAAMSSGELHPPSEHEVTVMRRDKADKGVVALVALENFKGRWMFRES
ncbi:hypothetical protein P7C70_g2026, partial [Phenoliferia sp. Uapishka_3]